MLRFLSIICVFAAAGTLVWAAYLALHPSRTEPPFVVTPAEIDLGTIPLGDRTIAFAVTNPADHPRRIIGLREG